MRALEKRLFSATGDPNGTRTRVFAVKGEKALKSRPRPTLHLSFPPLRINDLRERGDGAQGMVAEWRRQQRLAQALPTSPVRKDAPMIRSASGVERV